MISVSTSFVPVFLSSCLPFRSHLANGAAASVALRLALVSSVGVHAHLTGLLWSRSYRVGSAPLLHLGRQLIRQCYEENHGMSLERAIKKETSGSFEKLLLALTMDPIAYYAYQVLSG